jgi:hypothetical protein
MPPIAKCEGNVGIGARYGKAALFPQNTCTTIHRLDLLVNLRRDVRMSEASGGRGGSGRDLNASEKVDNPSPCSVNDNLPRKAACILMSIITAIVDGIGNNAHVEYISMVELYRAAMRLCGASAFQRKGFLVHKSIRCGVSTVQLTK